MSASLAGKCVILTRPAEQSAEWVRVLESCGAEVLLLPAVRIVPPETWSLLDRELLRLEEFDWVLFTSRNAVRFVSERLKNLSCALCCDGSGPRVAAVGQATAEAARKAGWTLDCVAPDQSGDSLAHELRESLAGRRVLLPRSDRADDVLPIALEKNGAKFREAVAYLNLAPQCSIAPSPIACAAPKLTGSSSRVLRRFTISHTTWVRRSLLASPRAFISWPSAPPQRRPCVTKACRWNLKPRLPMPKALPILCANIMRTEPERLARQPCRRSPPHPLRMPRR